MLCKLIDSSTIRFTASYQLISAVSIHDRPKVAYKLGVDRNGKQYLKSYNHNYGDLIKHFERRLREVERRQEQSFLDKIKFRIQFQSVLIAIFLFLWFLTHLTFVTFRPGWAIHLEAVVNSTEFGISKIFAELIIPPVTNIFNELFLTNFGTLWLDNLKHYLKSEANLIFG